MNLQSEEFTSPWAWLPSTKTWSQHVAGLAVRWKPDPVFGASAEAIRSAVSRAALDSESWLRHPCVGVLTCPQYVRGLEADLSLMAWASANADQSGIADDFGSVQVPRDVVLWSADNGFVVPAGEHKLADVGRQMQTDASAVPSVDIWCRSTGLREAASWAALSFDEIERRSDELVDGINMLERHLGELQRLAPQVRAWLTDATKVIRPLVARPNEAHSSHDPDIPGMIAIDLGHGFDLTVELLVHETAHLHLRAAQAADPLVELGHEGVYPSPLRENPRPLVGVLLAFHALAYINAALVELDRARGEDHSRELPRRQLRASLDEARATVTSARIHFTEVGVDFVRRTELVADHGSR